MNPNRAMRLKFAALPRLGCALALTLSLTGCIIPTPHHDTGFARTNMDKDTLAHFVPGRTTREDVIRTLGEPDAAARDECKLAYRDEEVVAVWAVGAYGAGTGGLLVRSHFWIFNFSPQGRLQNVTRTGSTSMIGEQQEPALNSAALCITNSTETGIILERSGFWVSSMDSDGGPLAGRPTARPDASGIPDNRAGQPSGSFNTTKRFGGTPGEFLLTESNLVFTSASGFANAQPALSLPYGAILRAQLVPAHVLFAGKRLLVHTGSGTVHAFEIYASNGRLDGPATKNACTFIQSKIDPTQLRK